MRTQYTRHYFVILILISLFGLFSCIFDPIEEGSEQIDTRIWKLRADAARFGKKVDINDNNTVLVSALGDFTSKGDSTASVHVFEYETNQWNLVASFSEDNSTENYGCAIALGENIFAVSDCGNNKIYTYIKSDTSWGKLEVIVPGDESEFSNFGKVLDIYNNYLIVGSETGPAVLYQHTGNKWLEVQTLNVGGPQEYENEYDIDVKISENFLVTCKGRDIYAYNRSGSTLSNRTLIDSTRNINHYFNYRIDLYDSTLAVGDPILKTDYCGVIIYKFKNDKWNKDSVIEVEVIEESMGSSVEIHSDHVMFRIITKPFIPNYYFLYSNSEEGWVYSDVERDNIFGDNFELGCNFAIFSGPYIYKYK